MTTPPVAPPAPDVAAVPLPPSDGRRKRIETRDLVKRYRGTPVVNGVSIEMTQGEIVGLLGPNGAGKTTTFYMIVGLIQPSEGTVRMDGSPITTLPMYKRARLGIGYLPQEASVFRKLTARENILLVLETIGYRGNRKKRADQLLGELHIEHIADNRGFALSGGERRRVEIARALATEPAFLLLDEPFAAIDPIAREDISGIIRGLKDRGIGILITDHEARAVLSLTDRAYLMADGKVLLHGTAREIADNPIAREHYLGENFTL